MFSKFVHRPRSAESSDPRGCLKLDRNFRLDRATTVVQNDTVIRALITYSLILIATLPTLFRTGREQAVVELALQQQLASYARRQPRPRLEPVDRSFWVTLATPRRGSAIRTPDRKNSLTMGERINYELDHERGFVADS